MDRRAGRRIGRTPWLTLMLALAAASCGGVGAPSPAFTVGAAASLTDVVEASLERWSEAGGAPGAVSFASSSTLARQKHKK